MNRTRRKRTSHFFLILALMISAPAGLTWRVIRQDRLNRALIAAVKAGQDQVALTLLERGADAQTRDVQPDPRTPWRRLVDLVRGRQMQQAGAPSILMLVMRSPTWSNPVSTYTPSLSVVRALLQRGADPNAVGAQGYTVLMYAAVYNRPDLMRLLIAHGADPNVRDDTGTFPTLFMERNPKIQGYDYMFSIPKPGGGKSLLMCTIGRGGLAGWSERIVDDQIPPKTRRRFPTCRSC